MKLKNALFLFVLILLNRSAFSQVNIFPGGRPIFFNEYGSIIFRPDNVPVNNTALEKTTTVFAYWPQDKPYLDDIEAAFKANWTISPYLIVPYDSLKYYKGNDYSYLAIRPLNDGGRAYYNLVLWTNGGATKDGNFCEFKYAEIKLFPTDSCYSYFYFKVKWLNPAAFVDLQDKGSYLNWNAAYLKLYLQIINYHLENKKGVAINHREIKELRTSTLYIPDYVAIYIKINVANGRAKQKWNDDILSEFKEYKYPYKLLNNRGVNDLINSEPKTGYFLYFVDDCTSKHADIVNLKTGEIIFAPNLTDGTGDINRSDLFRIWTQVEKEN